MTANRGLMHYKNDFRGTKKYENLFRTPGLQLSKNSSGTLARKGLPEQML